MGIQERFIRRLELGSELLGQEEDIRKVYSDAMTTWTQICRRDELSKKQWLRGMDNLQKRETRELETLH